VGDVDGRAVVALQELVELAGDDALEAAAPRARTRSSTLRVETPCR
jgi:hypothetical protein